MPCIDFYMLGSGSASHPYRGTSSILLDAGMGPLLVDAGCTSVMMLRRLGYDPGDVASVIVTHGHVDHYCGLQHIGFIKTWRSGSARRLNVYTTRHASRLIDYSLRSIDRAQLLEATVGIARDGMEVSGFKAGLIPAVHTVEAFSLELVHNGVRILVSGDTTPTAEYRVRAQGAAIAVHEATLPTGMEERARRDGHSTVGEALAQVAGASIKVLYHISPLSEGEALEAAAAGRVTVGFDGLHVRLC